MIQNNNQQLKYTNSEITADWSETLSTRPFTVRLITPRIRGGKLRVKFVNLEPDATYQWYIKNTVQDADLSIIDGDFKILAEAETEWTIVASLVREYYQRTLNQNSDNKYSFILQKEGEGNEYRFDFQVVDDGVHSEFGELIRRFASGDFTYSGHSVDTPTNRLLDEKSLEKNNITTFTNSKIPTNLAVQNYVDSLNNQNVKLTGNQTIAGIKTFTSPVVGVEPTANNHFTTRAYLDPANTIYNQVRIVRDRFLASSLTFPDWKFYALENLYRNVISATQSTVLPDFLLLPDLSTDTSISSSTTLVNLGTSNASFFLSGTTVGSLVANGIFNTSTMTGSEYINSTLPGYNTSFTFFTKTRPAFTDNYDFYRLSVLTNGIRLRTRLDGKLGYTIAAVVDFTNSTFNYDISSIFSYGYTHNFSDNTFSYFHKDVINTFSTAGQNPTSTSNSTFWLPGSGSVFYRGQTSVLLGYSRVLSSSQMSALHKIF